jgi:steroid delta-isomerase-like uncharacterized protein
MVSAENRTVQQQLIDDWARHWSSHDLAGLAALFTDDLLYEDVTMSRVNRSQADLRAFGQEFFAGFPDVTFELTSAFASAEGGSAEWIMRGTHSGDIPGLPATGKRVEVRGASVFAFAGDKMQRCSDYWDMATFLRQLGVMPSS